MSGLSNLSKLETSLDFANTTAKKVLFFTKTEATCIILKFQHQVPEAREKT